MEHRVRQTTAEEAGDDWDLSSEEDTRWVALGKNLASKGAHCLLHS